MEHFVAMEFEFHAALAFCVYPNMHCWHCANELIDRCDVSNEKRNSERQLKGGKETCLISKIWLSFRV